MRFLFVTYCGSFYGIETWYSKLCSPTHFRRMSVAYHKAIKQMCGMKFWESNHAACEKLNVDIFRHLLTKRCLRHFLGLLNRGSPCIANLRYYFKVESTFVSQLVDTFRDIYGVVNCFSNDCDALFSRINFIQCTEPRSSFEFI